MQSTSTKTSIIQISTNQSNIYRSKSKKFIVEKSIELNSFVKFDNNAKNENLKTNSIFSFLFFFIVVATNVDAISFISNIIQFIEFVTIKKRFKRKNVERIDYNKFNNF
jgi:hypothetical protein